MSPRPIAVAAGSSATTETNSPTFEMSIAWK